MGEGQLLRNAGAVVLCGPVAGWALMLLLGVAHHEVSPVVPALGYWACVVATSLAAAAVLLVRAGVSRG